MWIDKNDLPETITFDVLPSDFKTFGDCQRCAIGNAFSRKTGVSQEKSEEGLVDFGVSVEHLTYMKPYNTVKYFMPRFGFEEYNAFSKTGFRLTISTDKSKCGRELFGAELVTREASEIPAKELSTLGA